MSAARFHSFTELVLHVFEPALADAHSEQRFELRSTGDGAQVWRTSTICGSDNECARDTRLLGWLTSRQVVDLLESLERSGIYEPHESDELVDPDTPLVSIALVGESGTRQIVDHAPSDGAVVRSALAAIHAAIGQAQERALAWAG